MEKKEIKEGKMLRGVGTSLKRELERRKGDGGAFLFDAVIITVAFLFSGCHIVFGAYPLAISFISVLSRGVWLALIGSIAGSFTLGNRGIVQSIIYVVVVFLRTIISGGDKTRERATFSESLALRVCASSIGAFIGAVYELLFDGFSLKSIIYGASLVLLSAFFTFAFSGILDGDVRFSDLVVAKTAIFTRKVSDGEKYSLYMFQASFLLFSFLISLSLKKYNVFGVSFAYLFSSALTLATAKRFGATRALAVGFVSSLCVSGVYSVSFALLGLASGILFGAGALYAVIGGGVLLSVWAVYAGGAIGFLSVFPEYTLAVLFVLPFIKKLPSEKEKAEEEEKENKESSDMVFTASLAYKTHIISGVKVLEEALLEAAQPLKAFGEGESGTTYAEYRDSVVETLSDFCKECAHYGGCSSEHPAPFAENVDIIARKLYSGEKLSAADAFTSGDYCHNSKALLERISAEAARLEKRKYRSKRTYMLAEEYSLFSKLIGEIRAYSEREYGQNLQLTDKLSRVAEEFGLTAVDARVFGERRKHVVIACEDKEGKRLGSRELREAVETVIGARLGKADFYKRSHYALMECSAVPSYTAEFAAAVRCVDGERLSGDTVQTFESRDMHFYALIADGMGTGETAHRTSEFVSQFLSKILNASISKATAFHILNQAIRRGEDEFSSTVDLLDFDLMTGEVVFFKSGAAASYVKRDSSIFRIRSETAPIGLMKNVDAERVRVEARDGDVIVMISDGVSQSPEDAVWLIEYLNKNKADNLADYADKILTLAVKNSAAQDDMSVIAVRIKKI